MNQFESYTAFEQGSFSCSNRYYSDYSTRIKSEDFQYLKEIALDERNEQFITLRSTRDGDLLRLGRYAGLVPLPSGNVLEILPKCFRGSDSNERARRALFNMLTVSGILSVKNFSAIEQEIFQRPLHYSIVHYFLLALERMVVQGISSSYSSRDEKRPVLRGKILVKKQLNEHTPLPQSFWTRAHEYSENRSENRVIRTCLDLIAPIARNHVNNRVMHLRSCFSEIPASNDPDADLLAWSHDRLMSHYSDVEPWCRLILLGTGSLLTGRNTLPALLYPMERLFESYVGACLEKIVPDGFQVISQSTKWSLCIRNEQKLNTLRPDFVLRKSGLDSFVLDAKWKTQNELVEVASPDLLQLYAYGRHYLKGNGRMALLYPKTEGFRTNSDEILYTADPGLSLRCIPIDLETEPAALKAFLEETTS